MGLIALTMLLTPVSMAYAQPAPPETPCDPEYMDALEARAFLEAQREITQNQNLIVKPDSVLEYSCFEDILQSVAGNVRNFSETTRWGPIPDQGPDSLDTALQGTVEDIIIGWLNNNFDHPYLGGRATINYYEEEGGTLAAPAIQSFLNDSTIDGTTLGCDEMRRVWDSAKCTNFFDRPDSDAFFDFAWYAANDPRDLPDGYEECTTENSLGEDLYDISIPVAFNNEETRYVLDPENDPLDDGEPYLADPVVTYLDRILPRGVDPADDCANPPIYTGIKVTRNGHPFQPYADAVCSNPSCAYFPTGTDSGFCN